MDKWIKKMWHIYAMEYYAAMRKKKILPFATTWMDLEGIMLSDISQRKTNIYDLTYIQTLNKKTKKQNGIHRHGEQTVGCQRWGWDMHEMGEGGQKVQTSSYKISKS